MASLQTVSATSNVAGAASTTTTKPAASGGVDKSFEALFADAKKKLGKGEKLEDVKGHEYAKVSGGKRDEMYVNLSGNARSLQAFDLVKRDGRTFHVYGDADKKVVVEIKSAAASGSGGTSAPKT
jgi:hypothetical protein